MAKIISENEKGVQSQKKKKRASKRIPEKDFDAISSKLLPGETLRKDGRVMWRPTKQQYDGPEEVKAVYASSLPELRQKEKEVLKALAKNISNKDSRITVNGLYQRWKKVKAGIRDNTASNYFYMYERFIEPSVLGRTAVVNVGKSDILGFYNKLIDERAMGVSTLDTLQNLLTQIFGLAVDDRIMPYNPALGALKQFKRATNNGVTRSMKRKALTVAEQQTFLDYLDSDPEIRAWRNLFVVLLGTGMRISELCGLTWNNVDFGQDMICIDHDLIYFDKRTEAVKCTLEIHDPKTDAGRRMIPMLPFVKTTLLQEKEFQDQTGIRCTARVGGYEGFVFMNRFGDVQKHTTCNRALKRLIRDCNERILLSPGGEDKVLLPYFSCHSLRHTAITRLVEAGVNIVAVQHYAGHVDISTTLGVYTDCQKEFLRESFGLSTKTEYRDIFAESLNGEKQKKKGKENLNLLDSFYSDEIKRSSVMDP